MEVIQQMYRGTSEEWKTANPILYRATIAIEELGERDESDIPIIRIKIGDGVRSWQMLPYLDMINLPSIQPYIDGKAQEERLAREALEERVAMLEAWRNALG